MLSQVPLSRERKSTSLSSRTQLRSLESLKRRSRSMTETVQKLSSRATGSSPLYLRQGWQLESSTQQDSQQSLQQQPRQSSMSSRSRCTRPTWLRLQFGEDTPRQSHSREQTSSQSSKFLRTTRELDSLLGTSWQTTSSLSSTGTQCREQLSQLSSSSADPTRWETLSETSRGADFWLSHTRDLTPTTCSTHSSRRTERPEQSVPLLSP